VSALAAVGGDGAADQIEGCIELMGGRCPGKSLDELGVLPLVALVTTLKPVTERAGEAGEESVLL
jgi:hypothetical protein